MTTLDIIPTTELLLELQRRGSATEPEPALRQGQPTSPTAVEDGRKSHPLLTAALQVVERVFQIPAQEVLGACREEHLVKARFATWLLLADQGVTKREIARDFQRLDVGTIRHGCLRGRALVQKDKAFARAMWDAYHELQRRTEKMTLHPRRPGSATLPMLLPAGGPPPSFSA